MYTSLSSPSELTFCIVWRLARKLKVVRASDEAERIEASQVSRGTTIITLLNNVGHISAHRGLKLDISSNKCCSHSKGMKTGPASHLEKHQDTLKNQGCVRMCEMGRIVWLSLEIQFAMLVIVVCLFIIYLRVSFSLQCVLLACPCMFGNYQKEIFIGGQI